ncbi:hypothetical protein SLS62_000532 [Diatrype stigma]|uniref:Uncharacterized protein n=1 Tax=Diatrype stigma TaxID=117547 RepID=A0AAN9YWT0_9PEZI
MRPWNGTIASAPFTNNTSAPVASITPAPLLFNGTRPLAANATIPLFHNSTSSARFANATTTRSSNSSAPTLTVITTTIETTCGETSTPFAVQVAQPGGMFDGWYLKLSGDAIIFAPPSAADSPSSSPATQFSVEGSGHLCAVGRVGAEGNAVIAIAETANATTGVTGSGVYFVDPEVLGGIADQGYAALQCDGVSPGGGAELTCAEGALEYWVGCGLGLDITSDGDGTAEIGGWNCTGVTLSPVYS